MSVSGWVARGDNLEGIGRAADQLDDDAHRRIIHQLAPIRGEHFRRYFPGGHASLGRVANQDRGDV